MSVSSFVSTLRCSPLVVLQLLFVVASVSAFSSSPPPPSTKTIQRNLNQRQQVSLRMSDSSSSDSKDSNKYKSGLDKGMTDKLVKESIAPWRPLRLFFYSALGGGAFIGGFISLTGFLAALSKNSPDLDVNTEYLNLGIDFGAVVLFAVLAKLDLDKGNEFDEEVDAKIEKVKEQKKITKLMRKREQELKTLDLEIQIGLSDDQTQVAPVRELQAGANQHMILIIGPKKACKDALIGANLLKMDFAMSNVLVVPIETGTGANNQKAAIEAQLGEGSGGFGSGGDDNKPTYEKQPYIARPSGDGWDEYIDMELADAIKQGGEKVKEEGIAIVVASNGKVIRRGVGKVPWRQMVEQLNEEVKAY